MSGQEQSEDFTDKAKRTFASVKQYSQYQKFRSEKLKKACAALFDEIDLIAGGEGPTESNRLKAMAKSQLEIAAMLAEKAVSRVMFEGVPTDDLKTVSMGSPDVT